VRASGAALPLVTVSGACLGVEVALAAASLPFGAVVVGSQARRTLSASAASAPAATLHLRRLCMPHSLQTAC